MFGFRKKVKEVDSVTTGCVDCGLISARSVDEMFSGSLALEYGASAIKIWREPDNKHHLIIVSTKPQRVFMSCQPPDALLNPNGVAEILNFIANIPESSEVKI